MSYETPCIRELGRIEELTFGGSAGGFLEGEDLYIYFPWPPWP